MATFDTIINEVEKTTKILDGDILG